MAAPSGLVAAEHDTTRLAHWTGTVACQIVDGQEVQGHEHHFSDFSRGASPPAKTDGDNTDEGRNMKSASKQFKLFDSDPGYRDVARPVPSTWKTWSTPITNVENEEILVYQLEETGRFHVLRELVPRTIISREQTSSFG